MHSGKNLLPLRTCVLGVIFKNHKVLVGKRWRTSSWQFPQGGVEKGEKPEEALRREIKEEIGLEDMDILHGEPQPIVYFFPPDLKAPMAKAYAGQSVFWFLCRPLSEPNLYLSTSQEFDALDWVSPKEAWEKVISWKKESYRKGLECLKIWAD